MDIIDILVIAKQFWAWLPGLAVILVGVAADRTL